MMTTKAVEDIITIMGKKNVVIATVSGPLSLGRQLEGNRMLDDLSKNQDRAAQIIETDWP